MSCPSVVKVALHVTRHNIRVVFCESLTS